MTNIDDVNLQHLRWDGCLGNFARVGVSNCLIVSNTHAWLCRPWMDPCLKIGDGIKIVWLQNDLGPKLGTTKAPGWIPCKAAFTIAQWFACITTRNTVNWYIYIYNIYTYIFILYNYIQLNIYIYIYGICGFSQLQLRSWALLLVVRCLTKDLEKVYSEARGFSLSAGVLNNICNLNPFENVRGDYPRYVQIYLLQWISTRTTL